MIDVLNLYIYYYLDKSSLEVGTYDTHEQE